MQPDDPESKGVKAGNHDNMKFSRNPNLFYSLEVNNFKIILIPPHKLYHGKKV